MNASRLFQGKIQGIDRATWRASLLAVFLWPLVISSGCAWFKKNPASVVTLGNAPQATSTGNASTPADVTRTVSASSVVLPAGSTITQTATAPAASSGPEPVKPSGSVITLAAPATLSFSTETQAAHTAVPPAPPAPPTPAALAQGASIRYFAFAGLAMLAVAAFCFYSGHLLAGVELAAGGVIVPILAYWLASNAALVVGALCVGAAVMAVWLWYSHVRPAQRAEVVAEIKERIAEAKTP